MTAIRFAATSRTRRPAGRARRQERSSARRACACSPLRRQAKSPGDEDRHLERQRHPRPRGAVRRVGAPRPPRRRRLQEIKATAEQLGESLTLLPDYWSYWHGGPKGYSGVSLHVPQGRLPAAARAQLPNLRRRVPRRAGAHRRTARHHERLRAQRRQGLRRQAPVPRGDGAPTSTACTQPGERVVLCGDLNVARARHRRHPQGAQGRRHRPAPRRARALRAAS